MTFWWLLLVITKFRIQNIVGVADIKKELLSLCKNKVIESIKLAEEQLKNYRLSASEETKSSAGDKYETGREMLQQEMDKVVLQRDQALKLQRALNMIELGKPKGEIEFGCLVITDQSNYFISVGLGQLDLQGAVYYAISPLSPIAQAMLGLKPKDSFQFNGKAIRILEIR